MPWIVPNPTIETAAASAKQADPDTQFFGRDIYFEIAAPDATLGEADYVVNAAGDWTAVTGREALRQSLLRRLITSPGEWQTKPDYGVGARQYVKAKNLLATRNELEARIRAQFLRDPRVERVDTVTVAQLDDGSAGVKISVFVTPRGRLRSDRPLPVQLELH